MRSRTFLFATLLFLPLFPHAAASTAPRALEAQGPDADGAFLLAFEVDGPGTRALALAVSVDGGPARLLPLGNATFPAGASRHETSFLPSEGPGEYAVCLVADGLASAPLVFRVQEGGGDAARVRFVVPDEPTWLNLTADAVNAERKNKTPGEPMVTRATLKDGNGLAELDGVWHALERDGAVVERARLVLNASANATSAAIESKLARSPLPAGLYTLRLVALKGDAVVASAARTFLVRDVAPVLLGGTLPDVTPDENATHRGHVVLGDRNAPSQGCHELRLYRGSARAEGLGLAVGATGPAAPLADADGLARSLHAFDVFVPKSAPAGSYRLACVVDGEALGSLVIEVRPLPALANVTAHVDADGLRLVVNATGPGHVRAQLGPNLVAAPLVGGAATLRLPGAGAWTLELRARPEGPVLERRAGEVAPVVPELRLVAQGARAWRVEAAGWDLAGAAADVTFARWDGAPEPRLRATFDAGRVRVDALADLVAGRYHAEMRLALPNGTVANASWHFEAGPWMRLRLGEPEVVGREARIPVFNEGGLPLRRLVVEGVPEGATLVLEGATPATHGKRVVLRGLDVAPGASTLLRLKLPDGPLRAGALDVDLRVLALPGAG